jgi:Phage portal protein, SPP1 Gp6-like
MPISVDVAGSPGWWMNRLFNQLADRKRRWRLQTLHNYHRGHAPLPQGAENAREAFEAFQRKARSNFAELIVSVMSERMTPVGFRTALDDDTSGDAEVGALWERTGLNVSSADVHDWMLALGEAYVIVGSMDAETAAPTITAEDPRFMIGDTDPANPRKLLAALKVLHDDAAGEDRAYLFLPGQVRVAKRKSSRAASGGDLNSAFASWNWALPDRMPSLPNFSARAWEWDEQRSGTLTHNRIPVVKFTNKYGMGEYEPHLDLLDRINHQILQRMIIAVCQAFRQRAVKGLEMFYPKGHPKEGQEIDYNEIFSLDPAALWQLPKEAEMWESAINDLRPILDAVKADLEHLASVTRTPMHMLSPAGENQSAEGASLAREGLVFKVEDRIARTSYPWAQVISLALHHAGEADRGDLAKLRTIWAPAQRLSLAERADAASKLKDILPTRTLLITVLGMSPADADRTMTEITDERILAAELAAQQQAALIAAAPQNNPASPPVVVQQPKPPVSAPAPAAAG